jgi:hypothetical protein
MKEQKRSSDFDKMLIAAVKNDLLFFVLRSIDGNVEKCEMRIKAYRKDYNEIELELCANEEEKLTKVISGNRILNIYVPDISVSFFAELKTITVENKIKLYLPLNYIFHNRRKHERIQLEKTCYLSFEYNNIMVRRPIYDLSIGGVSIILPKSDKIRIIKGKKYDIFVMDIGIRKIKVKSECINAFSINRFKVANLPYGGFMLAFRFTEIGIKDKEYLNEYIAHEMLVRQVQKKAN